MTQVNNKYAHINRVRVKISLNDRVKNQRSDHHPRDSKIPDQALPTVDARVDSCQCAPAIAAAAPRGGGVMKNDGHLMEVVPMMILHWLHHHCPTLANLDRTC